VTLHCGDGLGHEEFIRAKITTARKIERDHGVLITEATVKAVITTTELLDIGPLLDHRTPTNEGTDDKDSGDGQTSAVHLSEIPEGALFGLGCQDDG
jgi:hypothetical protein